MDPTECLVCGSPGATQLLATDDDGEPIYVCRGDCARLAGVEEDHHGSH